MSSSSSSLPLAHTHYPSLGPPVTEKLTRDNYILWRAQILPPIRGAQLEGILDGSVKAPPKIMEVIKDDKTKEMVSNEAYATWLKQDQQVLGHLLNSLTKDVLGQVATATTAVEAWAALDSMFSA
jgi:hypothetical protein